MTFWRYIPSRRGNPGDITELGLSLRRLHALPPPADFSLSGESILDGKFTEAYGVQKSTVAVLAHEVHLRALSREEPDHSGRYVVGIAGPPAAGKSTLAVNLRDELNARWGPVAEIAPMDGFHLPNEQLAAIGALARKGAPDTFDAEAFAGALRAVRQGEVVVWPVYDRALHAPVPAGVTFGYSTRIAITEGNYLLLDSPGWAQVRSCLDEAWYLDADAAVLEARLTHRHIAGGKSHREAIAKVSASDMLNARLIVSTRACAQVILKEVPGGYALTRRLPG